MAEGKNTGQAPKGTDAAEETWTREELIRDAAGFESTAAEVAGALSLTKGNKKNFTQAETQDALDKFRKREVS